MALTALDPGDLHCLQLLKNAGQAFDEIRCHRPFPRLSGPSESLQSGLFHQSTSGRAAAPNDWEHFPTRRQHFGVDR